MKLVITMAGEGSRFKNKGIKKEKYKIMVKNETMFEFSMRSLANFFNEEFVFVTRSEHDSTKFIENKCAEVGIDKYRIIELDELTSGQAATALAADHLIGPSEAVAVYNIDTYVEGESLSPESLTGDGCLPVFEAKDPGWSYCELDDNGIVTRVSEKEVISTYATLGFYYFKNWELFTESFERVGNRVEKRYGERFIAPLYNWLIEQGYRITTEIIDRETVNVLGTPEQVCEFDPDFATRYGLE